MALVRLGVRVATVMALVDRTFAGDAVYDSAITSLDDLARGASNPFIVVTTDDSDRAITGRDLLPGGSLDLLIEFAVATATDAGEMDIPHTDEGLELSLDLMERQIVRALIDEATGWSEDFKRLVPRITRALCRRGASAQDGTRFAARQLALTIDTLNDPDIGVAMDAGHPLKILCDRLTDAGGAYAALAAQIEAEAEGTAIPDWNRARLDLGVLRTANDAIRLGDYIEGEDADLLTEVVIEQEDDADDIEVTGDNAETQLPGEEE